MVSRQSELFQGMAYFKVGREQEARATLDHAVWLLDKELPRPGETYTDTKLTDSVLCKYARAKAEALLGPAPATRPATTRSVAN